MIAKGSKQGRLFPLQLSTHDGNLVASAWFSDSSSNKCHLWHNRLGHPDSQTLLTLLNSGLLFYNKVSLKDVSFNCSNCKMGKNKTLPLPISTLYH